MVGRLLIAVAVLGMGGEAAADVYRVRTAADPGRYSLRWAIWRANSHPGDDRIIFAKGLAGKIIQPAKSDKGYFYGGAVRGGTRPHFPPPSALYDWVMVKLGVPMPAARGVAFMIARKISEVGTKPQPYQKEALKANMTKIQNVVNGIGQKIAIKIAQP